MKTLVFLSDRNRYLEHELYLTLVADLSKDFNCIYLDAEFDDKVKYCISKEQDRIEKKAVFNSVEFLAAPQKNKRPLKSQFAKLKRIFSNLRLILKWRRTLLETIREKNPAGIIMVAPNNVNARVLRMFRKDLKLIYLQPATIRRTTIAAHGIKAELYRFWYNYVLRVPRYVATKSVFEIGKELHFILWSKLWVSGVQKKANSNFHECGAPVYDRFIQSFNFCKAVPSNAKVMVLLNKKGHDPETYNSYARFYQSLITDNPSLQFTFKIHPLDDVKNCQELFSNSKTQKERIVWDKVDLVLTHWSTLAYEAMAIGIPTILVNPNGQFDFKERYMNQYEAIADSKESFKKLLLNFQNIDHSNFHTYRNRFLNLSFFSTDGRSKERVIDRLKAIIAGE